MDSTPHDRQVNVLNGLIAVVLDSAGGYANGAVAANGSAFHGLFDDRATWRTTLAADLQGEVRSLGGQPVVIGTMIGVAYRHLVKLCYVATRSAQLVIADIEMAEDYLLASLEEALEALTLDHEHGSARALLFNTRDAVEADHNALVTLIRSLQAR